MGSDFGNYPGGIWALKLLVNSSILFRIWYRIEKLTNIWEKSGWFGDQDTKTSQEPKLWKNWKIGHFGKNLKKGNYKLSLLLQ